MAFLDVTSFVVFSDTAVPLKGSFVWILTAFSLRKLLCIIPMVVSCFLLHFLKPFRQFSSFRFCSHTDPLGERSCCKVRWQQWQPHRRATAPMFCEATGSAPAHGLYSQVEEEFFPHPLFSFPLFFSFFFSSCLLHLFLSTEHLSTRSVFLPFSLKAVWSCWIQL